jgi:hypothetical protein
MPVRISTSHHRQYLGTIRADTTWVLARAAKTRCTIPPTRLTGRRDWGQSHSAYPVCVPGPKYLVEGSGYPYMDTPHVGSREENELNTIDTGTRIS